MENSEAGKLLNSIHGPSSRAVYHPERLRKNRYSLTIAASGSGGVNDMQEIGCGKDWEDAFADMWKQSITELEAKLAALEPLLRRAIIELEYIQCVENCHSGLCATSEGKAIVESGTALLGLKDLADPPVQP